MPDADLSLAVPAVFFGSVGTAGQRCTSTRRLYLHRAIAPEFLARLQALYASPALQPGDPLDARTLLGPLHSRAALNIYDDTIKELKDAGAEMILGDSGRYENLTSPLDGGNFVRPTIAMIPKQLKSKSKFKSKVKDAAAAAALWAKERFVPVLCVTEFEELDEAISWNNAVPQGLSSSLWTRDLRHVGKWIGPAGSDTGIVNVSAFCLFFFFCLVETIFFFFL
jgi:aldehyde dehydrogenase family 7 member A1